MFTSLLSVGVLRSLTYNISSVFFTFILIVLVHRLPLLYIAGFSGKAAYIYIK
jgi:hypothetical protein